MKTLQLCCLVLVISLLCACASSSKINDGNNGIVRFQQFNTGKKGTDLELVLIQDSHKDFDKIFEAKKTIANIKKTPLETYRRLVEILVDDFGFLDAVEAMPPGSEGDSSKVISIENEFGKWVLPYSKDDLSPGQKQDFIEMITTIRACYDSIFSLQFINVKKGGKQFFQKEQKRIEEVKKEQEKEAKKLEEEYK